MRFGESGPVSRGPPAGTGMAVLPRWLLFPSDRSKWKDLAILGEQCIHFIQAQSVLESLLVTFAPISFLAQIVKLCSRFLLR